MNKSKVLECPYCGSEVLTSNKHFHTCDVCGNWFDTKDCEVQEDCRLYAQDVNQRI